ncbi:unnamed protein product [Symbiodinium sp. CCMP2456]|nr:unnamed protein product [Symbiodinium sp. CCMP2456]
MSARYEWDGDEASGKPVEVLVFMLLREKSRPRRGRPAAAAFPLLAEQDLLILQRRYQLEEWSLLLYENSYRLTGPVSWAMPHCPEMLRAKYEDSFAESRDGQLFEQIKAEMCDTFVSYLCASLPTSLLKKYSATELVGCLQILLQELRSILSEKELEDLLEEEPTSVAEELRKGSPLGWLAYLQSISPQTLCSRFDVSELVDTLQALCQTAFDRLVDELGPMQRWVSENSRLYVAPSPAPPPAPADATSEPPMTASGQAMQSTRLCDRRVQLCATASASRASATQAETWSAELHDAPWQAPPHSPAPAANDMLSTAPVGRPPPSRSGPAPVFNATLGPAPWEMNLGGAAPATAAPRMATGSRLATGGRPATQVSSAKALLSR